MSGEKILVIDDDERFRYLFFQTLQKAGYQVHTAENGKRAFHLLKKEAFDLSLVDIKMPSPNGFSILAKVKEEYPRMKVIMITAYGTADAQARSLELGADRFLTKPLDLSELKEAVRMTLDSSR